MWNPSWWNLDGLPGIAGDQDIITSLYEIQVHSSGEKNASTSEKICKAQLNIIKLCLNKIEDTSEEEVPGTRRHYFDYLRWNKEDLLLVLEESLQMADVEQMHPDIHVLKNSLLALVFLTEEEKELISEYRIAFNLAVNTMNFKLRLNAARKFVDVIDLLYRKGIVDSSTSKMTDINSLNHHCQYIQEWLPAFLDAEHVLQCFDKFCTADSEAKEAQKKLLEVGLGLAKSRAEEELLVTLQRQCRETLQFVKELLKQLALGPLSKLKNDIADPLGTVKSAGSWVYNNPVATVTTILRISSKVLPIIDPDLAMAGVTKAINVLGTSTKTLKKIAKMVSNQNEAEALPTEEEMRKMTKEELDTIKDKLYETVIEVQDNLERMREESKIKKMEIKESEARIRRAVDQRNEIDEIFTNTKNIFDENFLIAIKNSREMLIKALQWARQNHAMACSIVASVALLLGFVSHKITI